MGVAERGVDHRRQRHREDELVGADARQQAALGQQAVVGRAVQLEDRRQVRVVAGIGDAHQHALAARRVARGDQPVGVARLDRRDGRQPHQPGPPRVEQAADRLQRGHAAADHVGQRRRAGEEAVAVGEVDPAIGEAVRVEHAERLEDADDERDARQPIDVEQPIGLALHLVVRPVRDAAEEQPGVVVPHLPAGHDVEERAQPRAAQPLAGGAIAEVDGRGGRDRGRGVGEVWRSRAAGHVCLLIRSVSGPGCARQGVSR